MNGIEIEDIQKVGDGQVEITFVAQETVKEFMKLTLDERDIIKIVAFSDRALTKTLGKSPVRGLPPVGPFGSGKEGMTYEQLMQHIKEKKPMGYCISCIVTPISYRESDGTFEAMAKMPYGKEQRTRFNTSLPHFFYEL